MHIIDCYFVVSKLLSLFDLCFYYSCRSSVVSVCACVVLLLFLVGDEREVWGLLMAVTTDLVLYMPVFGLKGNEN